MWTRCTATNMACWDNSSYSEVTLLMGGNGGEGCDGGGAGVSGGSGGGMPGSFGGLGGRGDAAKWEGSRHE